jgi:hypothetical protein
MIKANELRMGNLILKNGNLHYTNYMTIRDVYGRSVTDKVKFEPIPLTEEWLFKFGFVYLNEHGWIKNNVFDFLLNSSFELDWYENAPCKHVHQLQNLYFALTGEELKFK